MKSNIYLLLLIGLIFSSFHYALAQDQANNEEIKNYLNQVKKEIGKIWKPDLNLLRSATNNKISVNFYLDKEGNPSEIEILESSGKADIDENIIETVKKNAPYLKIPESAMIDKANISYTFLIEKSGSSSSQKEVLAYHRTISNIVTKNFKPPHFGTNKYASVRFLISEEGKVKDFEITESSENEKFDEKCKAAVLNSEPFPKPPIKDLAINYSFSKKSPLNGFPIIIPIPIPLH